MIKDLAISIIDKEVPLISNLANVSSVLYMQDNLNWAGFYLVGDKYLYLAPFQGEPACTTINFDKGICGRAYRNKETIIIDDVLKDKDHIACSSKSRSEIVTPIIKNDQVVALIDIDSPIYNRFNEEDKKMLEELANYLSELF